MAHPVFDNRVTRMLGVDIPIANAPMGGVVNPVLVAAVAEAGGIGMIPGSMGAAYASGFIEDMKARTNRTFGVNIPVSFSDPSIADTLQEQGIRYVTTSTGPVASFTAKLQQGGIKVFHVVTSLDTAKQAADAGVDGLIVEGSEGAGLRGATEVSMMVLLPLITGHIDLPVIAAGGIVDGVSMAAAFAMGAEGVQMGTRMLASLESSVHDNFKATLVATPETGTLFINRHLKKPLRVLRTRTTEKYEFATEGDAFMELVRGVPRVYQEGDMEAGFASVGSSTGRIEDVAPVAEIIRRTVEEFGAVIERLGSNHLRR